MVEWGNAERCANEPKFVDFVLVIVNFGAIIDILFCMKTATKVISISSVLVILALAGYLFFKFGFVYAEGTDTGELNYFSREGVVFKTYEGKIVQAGLKKAANAGVQSNEFKFSVADERIADSLMHCTGKVVEVHYQKYLGALPWRGNSVFVVDSIWSIK